jgi:hypothetical protein
MNRDWTPNKGIKHPDADAIIQWALGKANLQVKRAVPQRRFDEYWSPSNFPSFNSNNFEVRVARPRKFQCQYKEYGKAELKFDVVDEHLTSTWDHTYAGTRKRVSEWALVVEREGITFED